MGTTVSMPMVGAVGTTTPREDITSLLEEDKMTEIYNQLIIWLPITAGVIITTYVVYKVISLCTNRRSAYAKVKQKEYVNYRSQEKLELKLNGSKDINKWKSILELPFQDLSHKLRTGELSAVDTLHAFQWKSVSLNKKQNCIVHFIEDAEDEARKCDNLPINERQALHGIPVSIKECFHVRGCDSTAGLTQYLFKPSSEDGLTVKLLRKNGAIPFCMTNVPQTMMGYQCSNPCFGATGNPYDSSREVGGSSGGEGSLIGGGGSILGVGSDIGGSLRCPAALCGISSLRPTKGRDISLLGMNAGNVNQVSPATIPCVSGFMSSSVNALVTGFRTMWNDEDLAKCDKEIIPTPWKDTVFNSKRKLRIGYCKSDGYYEPHPGCKRAVVEAITLLDRLGHQTIEFESPDMEEVSRLFAGTVYADKFKDLSESLTYSTLIDSSMNGILVFIFLLNWTPTCLRTYVINPIMSMFTKTKLNPAFDTGEKLFRGVAQKDAFVQSYLEKMNKVDIDLIVFPASLVPAPKQDYQFFGKVPTAGSSWITWNLFDFPAGILPVTKVSQEDENILKSTYPTNDMVYTHIINGCKDSIGMPLAVQIVGRRYNEEMILRIMNELESITEFRRD